jgi:hypothetical protein
MAAAPETRQSIARSKMTRISMLTQTPNAASCEKRAEIVLGPLPGAALRLPLGWYDIAPLGLTCDSLRSQRGLRGSPAAGQCADMQTEPHARRVPGLRPREAHGVRAACCRSRLPDEHGKRRQAGRTPHASRPPRPISTMLVSCAPLRTFEMKQRRYQRVHCTSRVQQNGQ